MRKTYLDKGFTLIELLVVIAIIGVLSSVVLASLNAARNKGADAAIKSNLANLRAQAEIFYNTYSKYNTDGISGTGVATTLIACSTGNTVFEPAQPNTLNAGIVAASNANSASTWKATCALKNDGTSWAVSVPLKYASGSWCVDNTGASKAGTASGGGAAAAVCI